MFQHLVLKKSVKKNVSASGFQKSVTIKHVSAPGLHELVRSGLPRSACGKNPPGLLARWEKAKTQPPPTIPIQTHDWKRETAELSIATNAACTSV